MRWRLGRGVGGSLLSALAKVGKHDRRPGNEQTREGRGQRRQNIGEEGEGLRAGEGGRDVQMANTIRAEGEGTVDRLMDSTSAPQHYRDHRSTLTPQSLLCLLVSKSQFLF